MAFSLGYKNVPLYIRQWKRPRVSGETVETSPCPAVARQWKRPRVSETSPCLDNIKSDGVIDDVLFKHPKVKDAITVGIPDEYRGETVKVFVQLVEGQTATEEELRDFCREHLTAYKVPKFIEFRSELPRSTVGKALRRILRDEEIAKMDKS